MPYHVAKSKECPASKPWAVIKTASGEVLGCHPSEEKAKKQMAAIGLHEGERGREMNLFERIAHEIGILLGTVEREEVTRPYPNEHSARLEDPDKYIRCRRQNDKFGEGIDAIFCVTKDGKAELQAIRFDADKFTPEEAKAWLKEHDHKPISFEKATGEKEEERAIALQLIFDQIVTISEGGGHRAWIHDVYREDDGSLFAVMSEAGKLYRVSINITGNTVSLGTWVEVTAAFLPAVQTRTTITRQTDGRYRWVSISATAVLNRVGEIDSTTLFDSFVAHATETGEYPFRTFYHQGEAMCTGQCDFLAREGVTLITSGLYNDSELAKAEIEALQRDAGKWGESIGYLPTGLPQMVAVAESVTIPVYSAGVLREISTLPQDCAASWFTAVGVMEVQRMRKEVFDALVQLCGGDEEKARKLAESADGLNREVAEGGLIARASEPVQEPTPTQKPEPEPEVEREIELDEAAMALIAQQFDTRLAEVLAPFTKKLDGLTKLLDELRKADEQAREATEQRIKALEATDDEKQRVWSSDLPRKERLVVTHRPREVNADPEKPEPEPDPAATALARIKAAKGNL